MSPCRSRNAALPVDSDHVQPDEQVGGIRQVADCAAHRKGAHLDECRSRDDLVVTRKLRLLIDINNLQVVFTLQFGFAQLANAAEGLARSGGCPRHVESEEIFFPGSGGHGIVKAPRRAAGFGRVHARKSKPIGARLLPKEVLVISSGPWKPAGYRAKREAGGGVWGRLFRGKMSLVGDTGENNKKCQINQGGCSPDSAKT